MGMLTRYQKAGGFLQILQLIETCGKQKQDNFLQMIEKEDIRWANAIREKMITIERVFSWDDNILGEIAVRLHELTLATALHGFKPEERERMLKTFSHSQRRNIDDIFKTKAPNPLELTSAYLKILQEVRNMITQGYLRADKFDPSLLIPRDYEDNLGKSISTSPVFFEPEAPPTTFEDAVNSKPTLVSSSGAHSDGEVNTLKSRINSLTQENSQLKAEARILREKLAQIKKIA